VPSEDCLKSRDSSAGIGVAIATSSTRRATPNYRRRGLRIFGEIDLREKTAQKPVYLSDNPMISVGEVE
jgi:hypothetical protein